jgi:hypothetical protein
MKKMKNFIALLLALVMTMSLMACGNKTDEETKTGEDIGCYVQTTESGEKVLVDKDGNAVTDYTLDDEGNVVDTQGVVVVKAADITAYEKSEEKDAENKTDASEANTQKPEDTAKPDGENKSDAQKTDTKVDNTKKDETKKDDAKQETQKPADNKQDTTKPETKPKTKPEVKPEPQKPAAPSYDNGSLTTAQVKELQRWYGVSADGQWGAGSKRAAGGRTADEAWAYYQSNKQITTPENPSGGNTGNTGKAGNTGNTGNSGSGNTGNTGSTGSTGGGSTAPTTPSEPAKPTKANIDCVEVMRAGNEYAQSLGFDIWDGCRSYMTPIYFEEDYSDWSQAQANAAIKEMVDAVKRVSAENGRWTPEVEGWAAAVNCVARWDASAGHHEFYVYYAA